MTTRCRSSSRQRGANRTPPLRHPGHVRALAIGQTEFAWKLYKACRAQSISQPSATGTGNLHFSPLIVHHALTMMYAGSRYQSQELLRTVLCLRSIENDAAVNLAYGDVTRSLGVTCSSTNFTASSSINADDPSKKSLELHLATRLYVPMTHCGLLDQYVTLLRVYYGSDVAKVPFHTDRARACREINQWVEESTEQTVKDLVRTPHGLATFVSLVLANAVYFRAAWDKRFAAGKAQLAPFHNGHEEIVQVMTFKAHGNFRHGLIESAACRIAEVPFANERYTLILILPIDEDQGLDVVEAKLDTDLLVHLEEHLIQRSKVKLTLPRFRVDDSVSMGRVLTNDSMGIGPVFARGTVNLSGISGNNNLHLSHVEHKVCFEMDHVSRTKLPKKSMKPEATDLNQKKKKVVDKKTIEVQSSSQPTHNNGEELPSNGPPPASPKPPLHTNGDNTNESKEETMKTKKKTTTKEEKLESKKTQSEEEKVKKSKKSKGLLEFNRPFIYVVRDRHLGMMILLGCVRKLIPPPTVTDVDAPLQTKI